MEPGYTRDNAWIQARERLGLLETHSDPASIRHLERLGVADGWHGLEVGAGGSSITRWLSQKAGIAGRVLATDMDTRFLEGLDCSHVEVPRHDIVSEALPEAAFDLVHDWIGSLRCTTIRASPRWITS